MHRRARPCPIHHRSKTPSDVRILQRVVVVRFDTRSLTDIDVFEKLHQLALIEALGTMALP